MGTSQEQSDPIPGLTACFTCMNSMRTMPRSLDSIQGLVEHVVVVDSGSTDGTIEFCRERGAEVVHRDWTNFPEQKTRALELCADSPWVLNLDSDESPDSELVAGIRSALADPSESVDGFELNRLTLLHGQLLRHTFQPEWRLRLCRGGKGRVNHDSPVHDRIDVPGGVERLPGVLVHDSWIGATDMLTRGVRYGALVAEGYRGGGRPINLLVNPASAFLKQLLLRRGFLDGWRGWVAAGGVASQALAKHLAIMELRELKREERRSS
ncbi:MAG: hypothetical protein CBC35_00540 [Planctomycetes bacterium TMED75]|nr:hypothetical protein [Planctomycetaceae bacterium]OUU96829.1 MAG: hypothetical protein CBC35_00540 [Planctomycetes bacterium TMED75]